MKMRAKMHVIKVERHIGGTEVLHMSPVAKSGPYPADGSDEDNTFARFSPVGSLSLTIANPALHGKFEPGKKYYVDFVPAE